MSCYHLTLLTTSVLLMATRALATSLCDEFQYYNLYTSAELFMEAAMPAKGHFQQCHYYLVSNLKYKYENSEGRAYRSTHQIGH